MLLLVVGACTDRESRLDGIPVVVDATPPLNDAATDPLDAAVSRPMLDPFMGSARNDVATRYPRAIEVGLPIDDWRVIYGVSSTRRIVPSNYFDECTRRCESGRQGQFVFPCASGSRRRWDAEGVGTLPGQSGRCPNRGNPRTGDPVG